MMETIFLLSGSFNKLQLLPAERWTYEKMRRPEQMGGRAYKSTDVWLLVAERRTAARRVLWPIQVFLPLRFSCRISAARGNHYLAATYASGVTHVFQMRYFDDTLFYEINNTADMKRTVRIYTSLLLVKYPLHRNKNFWEELMAAFL